MVTVGIKLCNASAAVDTPGLLSLVYKLFNLIYIDLIPEILDTKIPLELYDSYRSCSSASTPAGNPSSGTT